MHLIAYNSPTTVISDQNAFNEIAMLKKKKGTKERRINIKIDWNMMHVKCYILSMIYIMSGLFGILSVLISSFCLFSLWQMLHYNANMPSVSDSF